LMQLTQATTTKLAGFFKKRLLPLQLKHKQN